MNVGKRERTRRETALRRLAARQHGLIHRDQALGLGLSKSGIDRRVRSGVWVRHYRCVYGVEGAPDSFEQRGLAACMAVGSGAALSHTSAGHMWGFCDETRCLHVRVAGSVTREPPGVCVHRTTAAAPGDVGKLRRVPVTSPFATLVDLAATLPEHDVERALQVAVVSGIVRPDDVRTRLADRARPGRRGPAVLRKLLPESQARSRVVTPLEKAVAAVLSGAGMPPAVREHAVDVGGRVFYLDFAFPAHLVAVEADGRRWHSDPEAFERDRERQNVLTAAGWRILRVTDRQVRAEPDRVRAQVLGLVGSGPGIRR